VNISLQTCPERNVQVIFKAVDGETVLVNPERGKIQVINAVGARVWELIDGQRSAGLIAALLCEEFEVEAQQAEVDVLNFLNLLAEKGLCL